MSLESSVQFIADLDPNQPPGSDPKSQGDNHVRNIKLALKNTFPGATRAFQFPTGAGRSSTFNVLKADINTTFFVDTSVVGVTAVLPVLVAGDVGWSCSFVKLGGVNPMFVAPASGVVTSGELSSLAYARRNIPGHRTDVVWSGSGWFLTRIPSLPVGTVIDWPLATLPAGYEWANGQTLNGTNYPEMALLGGLVLPDRRGRIAAGRDDMGGAALGLITSLGSGINGTVLRATGGAQNVTLATENLPPYTPGGSLSGGSVSISGGTYGGTAASGGTGFGGGGGPTVPITATAIAATLTQGSFSGSAQGGTSAPLTNMPPTQITNMIVVVE